MESEVRSEDLAEIADAHSLADRRHCSGVAVRKIDAEQAVGAPRSIEHGRHLNRVPPERLLAKNCGACLERSNALLRVHPARSGDHHAIGLQRKQFVERIHDRCVGRELLRVERHFFIRIANGDRLRRSGAEHRLHAVAADPSGSEKTEPDHVGTTTALTKLPGRSRVASSASASFSSG